ncbi:NAD(P)H-dependent oxidoreductase [Aureitalea marina]|jgi:nitroreductase|uniref:NAD(P)H-dependent oxidoreductase n=1 Tax=Aureitalea marina TaxID=930804 RepID=A0A2S7KQL7_9FLAO|nr:NAD(P)H-dependent oxidoreductase [Aureitalea marina]PQB04863.1 NAD(P)H-dependent oxidoreductase [Aureitalea marina]
MSNYLDSLNWRYATKKFDPSKSLSDEDLDYIKEAMRLSASSYGLQPYEVLIIQDPEIRAKLKPASWNQTQITDAAYVVVIANQSTFGDELVDDYIDNLVETRGVSKEDVQGYADFMKNTLGGFPEEIKAQWTAKQSYIVLANLLSAAAERRVDACPMEGFDPAQYNEILGLGERNLNAAVVATIGYRSDEDATQHYPKVRKSNDILFKTI